MCKSANEPGGPHRCSADLRKALLHAENRSGDARREVDALRAELADAGRTYSDDSAFRMALNARIRAVAQRTGEPHAAIAQRFARHQFLARLGDLHAGRFVVTGGTALQMRTDQARTTGDADLAARDAADTIHATLESAAARRPGERGEFSLKVVRRTTDGLKYSLTYKIGGTRFATIGLDVTTDRLLPGSTEVMTPEPVVDIDDVARSVPLEVYPVADHVADKVGAMYEKHGHDGDSPSSRAHDLADLAIIARTCSVDGDELSERISAEAARRHATVPNPLTIPSESWHTSYADKVKGPNLPAEAANLESALETANRFLRPVLDGAARGHRWDPDRQLWEPRG